MKGDSTDKATAGVDIVVQDISWRRFARARESEVVDDGLRAILVPRFDGAILRRLLMPRLKKPCFRIRLDRFGSFIWDSIDGRATVAVLADRFMAANPGEEMARERVALFVRTLAIQGHVVEMDGPDVCDPGITAD